MKSPAYNEAMAYAVEVLKAIRESGCEMDYPLKQFVDVSVHIGVALARAESPVDKKDMLEAYREANMDATRSIYWADILSQIEDYGCIPFDTLRKKCESLQGMLDSGVKLIGNLTGRCIY